MVIGTDYTGIEIQLLYTQFHDSPLINMNYIDHINILQKIYVIELQKGQEGKTMEPLRPPSHLFPGGSLHRPTDLSASAVLLSQGMYTSVSYI
jgi:hypothetical protein